MRYRVTVRGDWIELRGYVDGTASLTELSHTLQEAYGTSVMIVASPADDHYNPFALEDL